MQKANRPPCAPSPLEERKKRRHFKQHWYYHKNFLQISEEVMKARNGHRKTFEFPNCFPPETYSAMAKKEKKRTVLKPSENGQANKATCSQVSPLNIAKLPAVCLLGITVVLWCDIFDLSYAILLLNGIVFFWSSSTKLQKGHVGISINILLFYFSVGSCLRSYGFV